MLTHRRLDVVDGVAALRAVVGLRLHMLHLPVSRLTGLPGFSCFVLWIHKLDPRPCSVDPSTWSA
jgi:hypothetical protein